MVSQIAQPAAAGTIGTAGTAGSFSPSRSGAAPVLPPDFDLDAAAKAPFFKGLSRPDVEAFLAIGTPRSFKAGEAIIKEGDTDTVMYLLLRGKIDILKTVPPVIEGGIERQTSLFSPSVPGMFPIFNVGEMNLLAPIGRSATVVAVEDCETLVISKETFEALAERDVRLGYIMTRNFAGTVINNLVQTNNRVTKLTTALTLALKKRS